MQDIYSKLKGLLGGRLLEFILNRDDLLQAPETGQLLFTEQQSGVLSELNALIKDVRMRQIANDFPEQQYLELIAQRTLDGVPLFHAFRTRCGGEPLAVESQEDALLDFLAEIALREYPSLLLKAQPEAAKPYTLKASFEEMQRFAKLLKADPIQQLGNDKDGFDYALEIAGPNQQSQSLQVVALLELLLAKSFHNACYQADMSFASFLEQVKLAVTSLRALAAGKAVDFSLYQGLRGLKLNGGEPIDLEGVSLRQFDLIDCPNPVAAQLLNAKAGSQAVAASACIVEFTESSGKQQAQSDLSRKQALQLALMFATRASGRFQFTFSESSLVTTAVGEATYFDEPKARGTVSLTEQQVEELRSWYKLLLSRDLSQVGVPLRKLSQAIYTRDDMADALLDGLTALEALLGSHGETSFKVTSAVVRLLSESLEERKKLQTQLQACFNLRKQMLFGDKLAAPEPQVLQKSTATLIKLCLSCLAKVLNDPKLLSISAEQRVQHILFSDAL